MATGALDANGIWKYGEDDSETTFSNLLNKLGSSTSTKVGKLNSLVGYVHKGDALIDNNDEPAGGQIFSTTAWTDVTGSSFTVITTGKPARVKVEIILFNGSSGAARTYDYRVLDNGTQIGKTVQRNPVPYFNTKDRGHSSYTIKYTPTAGSHTIKVQVLTPVANSLAMAYTYVTLEEFGA